MVKDYMVPLTNSMYAAYMFASYLLDMQHSHLRLETGDFVLNGRITHSYCSKTPNLGYNLVLHVIN